MPDPDKFHRGGYGGREGASAGTLYDFDMPDAGAYNEAAALQRGYGDEQYQRLMGGQDSYAAEMLQQGQVDAAQGLQAQAVARGASPSAERAAVMGAGNMAAQNVGVADALNAQAMQQAQMNRLQTMNQLRQGEYGWNQLRAQQDQAAANHYAQMAGVQATERGQDLGVVGAAIGAGGAMGAGAIEGQQTETEASGTMPSGEACKRAKRTMPSKQQQELVDTVGASGPLSERAVKEDSPEAKGVQLAAQHMAEGFGAKRPSGVDLKLKPIRPIAPDNATERRKNYLRQQALRDYETYQPRGPVVDEPMTPDEFARYRRGRAFERMDARNAVIDDRNAAAEQRYLTRPQTDEEGLAALRALASEGDLYGNGHVDETEAARTYRGSEYGFDHPETASAMHELTGGQPMDAPWNRHVMMREQPVDSPMALPGGGPSETDLIMEQLRAGDMRGGGGVRGEMGPGLAHGSFQNSPAPSGVVPSGEDLKTVIGTLPPEQQVEIWDREKALGEARKRGDSMAESREAGEAQQYRDDVRREYADKAHGAMDSVVRGWIQSYGAMLGGGPALMAAAVHPRGRENLKRARNAARYDSPTMAGLRESQFERPEFARTGNYDRRVMRGMQSLLEDAEDAELRRERDDALMKDTYLAITNEQSGRGWSGPGNRPRMHVLTGGLSAGQLTSPVEGGGTGYYDLDGEPFGHGPEAGYRADADAEYFARTGKRLPGYDDPVASGNSLKCRQQAAQYDALMEKLEPKSYYYKQRALDHGAPAGKRHGIMAEQLEGNPMSESAVVQIPGLGKGLDKDELLSLAVGLHGRVNDRLERLERGK